MTMSPPTFLNGCNVPVNKQTGTIPDLLAGLNSWFQYLTFGLITKTLTAFQVDETVTDIYFYGVIQPLTGRQLFMKPEGQRQWNWISVYAQAAPSAAILELNIDDLIIYDAIQYRVMTRRNYGLYSVIYYELVQDYTGSVPTP